MGECDDDMDVDNGGQWGEEDRFEGDANGDGDGNRDADGGGDLNENEPDQGARSKSLLGERCSLQQPGRRSQIDSQEDRYSMDHERRRRSSIGYTVGDDDMTSKISRLVLNVIVMLVDMFRCWLAYH